MEGDAKGGPVWRRSNQAIQEPGRTNCYSRQRPRSWFLGVHCLTARPPLLSLIVGPRIHACAQTIKEVGVAYASVHVHQDKGH
jgi:hypothetical protein